MLFPIFSARTIVPVILALPAFIAGSGVPIENVAVGITITLTIRILMIRVFLPFRSKPGGIVRKCLARLPGSPGCLGT